MNTYEPEICPNAFRCNIPDIPEEGYVYSVYRCSILDGVLLRERLCFCRECDQSTCNYLFVGNTATTPVPDPTQEIVSVLIPAIVVPILFFIVLFVFCFYLKLSSKRSGPRKPSTYEDFSRVDNTEMLRMSTDMTLEVDKTD